ncbi:hypothetical protein CCACVL1_17040 [Corchorus capsularis]|uniref:Uncharacterized protein n=1 Tax=Corchorus capsularis TaxID=210143 RepID=A0A1R3HUB5_COCAP|nr:hypothetical protein CCACVL1_17040 [Corchorus capsularis]
MGYLTGKTEETKQKASETVEKTKQMASETPEKTRQKALETADKTKEKFGETTESTRQKMGEMKLGIEDMAERKGYGARLGHEASGQGGATERIVIKVEDTQNISFFGKRQTVWVPIFVPVSCS